MKGTSYTIIEAIQLLNPAGNPKLFMDLGLKLSNTEVIFVEEVTVDGKLLYAKAGDRHTMIPVDMVLGFEVRAMAHAWFKDAKTLPQILAKLQDEQSKKAA